jgi:PAS domain S-box-containing protein
MESIDSSELFDILQPEEAISISQTGMRDMTEHEELDFEYEFSLKRKDGTEVIVRTNPSFIEIDGISAYQIIVMDITQRKQMEDSLTKSEEKYRLLIENIPDVVWTTDVKGRTTYISPNVEQIYGYTQQEILDHGEELWFGRIHPDDVTRVMDSFLKHLELGEEFSEEYRIQRKDGEWIWLFDRSFESYEQSGEKVSSGVFTDVTQLKRVEEALRENEERYRAFFENSSYSIIVSDLNTSEIVDFNSQAYSSLGYSREEFAKLQLSDIDVLEDEEAVRSRLEEITDKGRLTFETKHRTKDKSVRDVLVSTCIISIGGKTLNHAIIQDITDQKILLQALEANEERLRRIFNESPIGMAVYDVEGRPLETSFVYQEIFGVSLLEHARGYTLFDDPNVSEIIKEAIQHKESVDFEIPYDFEILKEMGVKTSRSGVIQVHALIHPLSVSESGEPTGFLIQVREISEQKRILEALEESEELFRLLYESSGDAMVWVKEKKIVRYNNQAQKMFRVSEDELLGKTPWNISPSKQPGGKSSRAETLKVIEETLKGKPQVFKWRHKRFDGETFDCTVSLSAVETVDGHIIQAIIREIF